MMTMMTYDDSKVADALKSSKNLLGMDILDSIQREKSIVDRILRMVKSTFCKDADRICSYSAVVDDDNEPCIKATYIIWLCDSHTCVDSDETCIIPLKWFDSGFDYVSAYKKLMSDKCQAELSRIDSKKAEALEKIDDIRYDIECLDKERDEVSSKLKTFME